MKYNYYCNYLFLKINNLEEDGEDISQKIIFIKLQNQKKIISKNILL